MSTVALYKHALKVMNKDEKSKSGAGDQKRDGALVLPTYSSIIARQADYKDDKKRDYYIVTKDSFPDLYLALQRTGALVEGENLMHMLVKLPISVTRRDHRQEFPEMQDDLLQLRGLRDPIKGKDFTFVLQDAYFPHGAARGLLKLAVR